MEAGASASICKLMINGYDLILSLAIFNGLVPPQIPIHIILYLFSFMTTNWIVEQTLIVNFLAKRRYDWKRLLIGSILFFEILESIGNLALL